ncbi:MAG: YidC/Oxa1 family membrane protein insertase [Solirubrobacteraceae bacterium]
MLTLAGITQIIQPLIDVFEAVLKFYHHLGVPWGWAIVLLTVTIRACMIPLTIKQIGSMARMQQLQPEMKAIQAKYKQDKQRQQQEMMKFYKENNFNPLGSCLPMVAQLPVFVSLYYMLRDTLRFDICGPVQAAYQHRYMLKHGVSAATAHGQTIACGAGAHGSASFLFISDITNNPHGLTLVVLALLYVGSQLGSSLVMSAATMDPKQRKIMMFLPVVFVLFVLRFPAGLLVYWITTNLWTVGQQYIVRRRLGPIRAANAAAAAAVADGGTTGTAGGKPSSGDPPRPSRGPRKPEPNGAGSGGLGALIRKATGQEPEPVAAVTRGGAPPRSPRKKKKRSGRRR